MTETMTDRKPSLPAHYALLIGINAYREKPLEGCVRDVQCIKSLLEQQSFPIDIQIFTATPSSLGDKSCIDEDRAYWPTYRNVTKALESLAERTNRGDCVYIHYSGHGTYMPIVNNFTNHHTGDLALALLNGENGDSTRPFGGHRMAIALNAFVREAVVVTLVLDCCFAASVYRRDRPNAMQSLLLVVLAACGPTEESTEISQDGLHYGALSRFLYLALRDGGFSRRHKDIFYRLFSKFRGHTIGKSGEDNTIKQNPALYGNKEQVFFGQSTLPPTRPTIPVERSGEKLTLQAGQAHGVLEGDDFILYPVSVFEGDESLQSNIISASVETVHPLTSLLHLDDAMTSVAQIDWVAEPQTKHALRKLPVSLDESLPHRDKWLTDFDKYSISVHSTSNQCRPAFLVALVGNEYRIRDTNNQDIVNIPTLRQDHTSPEEIAAILEHLLTYRIVEKLTNHSVTDDFRASFDINIITRAREHFGPDSIVNVTQGNRNEYMFELCLQNNGNKSLYMYIYDLGPLWQIDGIYQGTYDVVPPKSLNPRCRGRLSRKLGTSVPKELRERGIHYCHDTLKVLVTSQPTCFDLLELPKVGDLPRKQSSGLRQGSGDNSPEQWAAFNFPVKTSLVPGLEGS
ncbi:hypothetical protein ACHAP5_011259 [Fusarium lateritium]